MDIIFLLDSVTKPPAPAVKPKWMGSALKPSNGSAGDLSAFGHVEARVMNIGSRAAVFALRVDNAGPWQKGLWNTEKVRIDPGGRVAVMLNAKERPPGAGEAIALTVQPLWGNADGRQQRITINEVVLKRLCAGASGFGLTAFR